MQWFATFTFILLWCAGAGAAAIQQSSVVYSRGVYTARLEGLVATAPAEVYRLVTDHDHLYLLNDDVLESVLLTPPDAPVKKRRVTLHVCILFFCRDMQVVESLEENGKDKLIAAVVPQESDFRAGKTVWQVTPEGETHSRLHLHSTFRPGFQVPPVIGPWLIKKKMEQELSMMITRLERHAGAARGH